MYECSIKRTKLITKHLRDNPPKTDLYSSLRPNYMETIGGKDSELTGFALTWEASPPIDGWTAKGRFLLRSLWDTAGERRDFTTSNNE